jgi:hypothetical protein
MNMNRLTFTSIALSCVLLLGCGKTTDSDKVADAQACIDRSAASEAESCLSKIEGVETKGAYLIRCVANFNKEGFTTPARMQAMMDAISNQTGASEMLGIMAALAFKSDTAPNNLTRSNSAYSNCNKAENKILTMFSTLGLMATECAGGDPAQSNAASLQGLMATCMSNTTIANNVGVTLINAYEQNCSGSEGGNGETCAQLQTVINQGGGTPAGVAQTLSDCLKSPPAAFCTGF